ncbi:hypothetical protein D1AOALGA4SA_13167 [Olavius algarvensis Delta 1 endosymbiont]|nr:hypothetical protein D1AOALGA4SA_13167 [Olavius algarvensis Delta 1 endosymbiont]
MDCGFIESLCSFLYTFWILDCRRSIPWNDGILECWNIGFSGMRSDFW